MTAVTTADSQQEISKFKVVLVGPDRGVLSLLDDALNTVCSESQRVAQGAFALDLIAGVGAVDLVVVSHPLPDLDIDAFLARLRAGKAQASSTPVAILTDESRALDSLVGPKCRVYSLAQPVAELVEALTGRVERAQRAEVKLLVRLSLQRAGEEILRLTQSENISRTGMLLRTKEDLPDQAKAEFEFSLPGEERPIVGKARIVRKAEPSSDALHAIAIQFESFRRSDLSRFEAFLAQLLLSAS